MSVALITRGMIAGFSAAGTPGEPYPLSIEDMGLLTFDIKNPIIDVDPEKLPAVPISFGEVGEYYPNKQSTIEVLPTAGLRTFPKPRNL